MNFEEGVKKLWLNTFHYLKNNRHSFALIQYGKSSPLLNKAYQDMNIEEGDFFAPILRFLTLQVAAGVIKDFPQEVHRALLFSPVLDLVQEYYDHTQRPEQVITEKLILECCDAVIKGMLK